jgi:hypothetical protein
LKDLASYVREELPGVINLKLDAAFGKKGAPGLDDQQKSELMLIITECHDLIVKKYQERIAGGEEMRSLSTGDDVGSVSTGSRVVLESQDIDMDSGQAEDENHFTF